VIYSRVTGQLLLLLNCAETKYCGAHTASLIQYTVLWENIAVYRAYVRLLKIIPHQNLIRSLYTL